MTFRVRDNELWSLIRVRLGLPIRVRLGPFRAELGLQGEPRVTG